MMRKLKVFLLGLLSSLALTVVLVHAQDQSGFISIDCGLPEGFNYTDETTGINYSSDAGFTDSGVIMSISPEYKINSLDRQFMNVRSFPQGTRNCYTLKPARGRNNTYLIRARFVYGNYDAKDQLPEFDLQLGVEFWDTVRVNEASSTITKEIIHVPTSDYIYVCLINTELGTPFISALELRPINNSIYITQSGSLKLVDRYDFGSATGSLVRYADDMYDRIWRPYYLDSCTMLSTSFTINPNIFEPPSVVMSTANVPQIASESLNFWWEPGNSTDDNFYIYMYFAEVEVLQPNQYREFNIYLNGTLWYEMPLVPKYLQAHTVYSNSPDKYPKFEVSIRRTANSNLPPIINALELYTVKQFLYSLTDEKDASAILTIKSMYGVTRNWQGDPCAPKSYVWMGVNCSYSGFDPPRIISLNLSSSGLTGVVAPSISDLLVIKYLDLSNNSLTGQVPNFLAQLPFLTVLNLKGNNFTGSVPQGLLDKSKNGSLSLSIDGIVINTTIPSKKKNKFVAPVVASVVAAFMLVTIIVVLWLWNTKSRKLTVRKLGGKGNISGYLELKKREFTYSEVLKITNNFQTVLGKGGFGTVYHGYVGDTQIAVKMLSSTSTQGYKEFQAEAKLLTSVHHKNLTSLIGYCNEGINMGLIYEYMANGNLESHLSGRNSYVLIWEERLRIAMDAAQGLEYLHNGCKPPIIHRDVKSANILLNENFQAKLADFGLSRVFPVEGGSHVSTVIVGTLGYLDPEYYTSNRLTEKSDVYSFGIVLLEIITGRPAIAKSHEKTHITRWVGAMLEKGDVKSIADPLLRGDFEVNSMWKVVELAMSCASRTSSRRPTMNYVVMELKECLATEMARHEIDSKDSIAMVTMNLESDFNPLAR